MRGCEYYKKIEAKHRVSNGCWVPPGLSEGRRERTYATLVFSTRDRNKSGFSESQKRTRNGPWTVGSVEVAPSLLSAVGKGAVSVLLADDGLQQLW